ncbi:MAG: Rossmann-like domain-containing protein [bacterium]
MNIAEDFLEIVEAISKLVQLPVVKEIYVAGEHGQSGKSSKFGAMVLEDGTVGLTFVDLDGAREELLPCIESKKYVGASPAKLAALYAGDRAGQRALGMAAVTAVSQFVLRRSGCLLADSDNTMDLLLPEPQDHIGMVGYFPPLVDHIREKNIDLTVIELDQQWVQQESGFTVTLDSSRLQACNKVLCTGTVLINNTLDRILEQAENAEQTYLVGPTLGCLPDPLFARGVTAIGGRQIVDCEYFIELWSAGETWRSASRRYAMHSGSYHGYKTLLDH